MNTNREQWLLINLTDRTITSGLPNVRAIPPGKATDLITAVSKDDVRQSTGIALLLQRGWAQINRVFDGTVIDVITIDNVGDLNNSIDTSPDGSYDLNGQDLNLNVGTGNGGGNVNLEGGNVNFNNDVSISPTGTIISANCSEFIAAADLTSYGRLTSYGDVNFGLPTDEPTLSDCGSFTFYQDGNALILKARNDKGVTIKIQIGDFTQGDNQ